MRYGIFSDVHANLEALQEVIAALKQEDVDLYLCSGDIVGYGADPDECFAAIKRLKAISVAGNHDWAVIGQTNPDDFNSVAKEAILWTRNHISVEARQSLQALPLVFQNEEIMMVHATVPAPEEFGYLLDRRSAVKMFQAMAKPICFIGHTNIPLIYKEANGKVSRENASGIKLQEGCRYIVNVGSVGQPRDGDPQAAYCVFDSELGTLAIKRVAYDIRKTQKKINDAGLPLAAAARLSCGE